jgi:hypothetical protein
MVDIAGPNRQATFAGTGSLGSGIQGPSQIGLAGLNFLSNQQQQTASQRFQDQLMRQQELQTLLQRADDRRESLMGAGELSNASDAPVAGERTQMIVSQLSGMPQTDRMLGQNMQSSGLNVAQSAADVRNTQAQALDSRLNAGIVPTLREGTMAEMLQRGQFNLPASGQDQGLTQQQQLEKARLQNQGIQITEDLPLPGGRTGQIEYGPGQMNAVQNIRRSMQTFDTSGGGNNGGGRQQQQGGSEQGGFEFGAPGTGPGANRVDGPAGQTPGLVGNEQQIAAARAMADNQGFEFMRDRPPYEVQSQSGKTLSVVPMRDPESGDFDEFVFDDDGNYIGIIGDDGGFVPKDQIK